MKTDHIIINGDSRKMKELEDESLHLVITSPPYWQLKDYGSENQVGYNDSDENCMNNLNRVWSQVNRILHKGCRLCVNIGDQFARAVYYGRYKVIPIRTEIIKFCESIGFDYMGAIIWQKKTTTNTTGGASLMGSYPTPRNGIISIDYEFILLFKKLGQPIPPDKELKEQSKMTKDEWKTYFSGHWNFGGAKQNGHIAMFPEELPKRLIKMFSFVGDTVLDPFLGSGTTTLAAKNLGRNSIGYEVNSEFIPFIKDKLSVDDTKMFDESNYTFKVQQNIYIDFEKEIEKLPYKFVDPHKFDKKIDLKKLQYGSKIDSNSGAREEYFIVKEIISPEIIKLSNNIIVRLIGVKKKKEINGEAIKFLERKTKGQKVYMKFDVDKYDSENHLLCYLYLKNKTFLNAHLIKEQLADVDDSFNYKYRNKFLDLMKYSNG
ncbi:MAG: thermonuclease family protein [Bacteroidetes bacterium]|nr:thermonuclease family protein [Bacteroidota bacterium]